MDPFLEKLRVSTDEKVINFPYSNESTRDLLLGGIEAAFDVSTNVGQDLFLEYIKGRGYKHVFVMGAAELGTPKVIDLLNQNITEDYASFSTDSINSAVNQLRELKQVLPVLNSNLRDNVHMLAYYYAEVYYNLAKADKTTGLIFVLPILSADYLVEYCNIAKCEQNQITHIIKKGRAITSYELESFLAFIQENSLIPVTIVTGAENL